MRKEREKAKESGSREVQHFVEVDSTEHVAEMWVIGARLREPVWGRRGNEGRNQMSCKSNKRRFKERDAG